MYQELTSYTASHCDVVRSLIDQEEKLRTQMAETTDELRCILKERQEAASVQHNDVLTEMLELGGELEDILLGELACLSIDLTNIREAATEHTAAHVVHGNCRASV